MNESVTHVITRGILIGGGLDGVGHKTKDSSNPQQKGESSEQLGTELDPFWGCLGGSQFVGSITLKVLFGLFWGQALK